jgi:hypothetical protein
MNKEVKIGFTIILVLMITFIAVVARKVYIKYAAEQALAVDDQGKERGSESGSKDGTQSQAVADMGNSDMNHPAKAASETALRPRVITATKSTVKPPQNAEKNDDPWNKPSRPKEFDANAGGSLELKPRNSFLPKPPEENAEHRYSHNDLTDSSVSPDRQEKASAIEDRQQGNQTYDGNLRRSLKSGLSTASARIYIAAEDESLFDVARSKLGDASRWVEIYDLNADILGKDIDNIAPGARIALP